MNVGSKELFITFKVEKSRYFKRDGSDVHTDAEISLSQAVFGGTIRIQGVYEDQTIQIMAGTSSHLTITLKGKGLKRVNTTGTGDHYVHIKIVIPKKLTEQQKALLLVRFVYNSLSLSIRVFCFRRMLNWKRTPRAKYLE